MASPTKAIIFDIGNVLFPIDFEAAFHAWAKETGLTFEEVKERFQFDEVHKAYERGEKSREDFRSHVCTLLGKEMKTEAFENGWNSLLLEAHPEMPRLLQELKQNFRLYALSNTNPIHIDLFQIKYTDILTEIDHAFYSSDIGAIKPEAKAFQTVLDEIQLKGEDVVFFDDYASNVQGAIDFGIPAYRVENYVELCAQLKELDLLAKYFS